MVKKHLTEQERFYIEKRLCEDTSHRQIGRELGVSHTTISREIRRNTDADFGLYSNLRTQTLRQERYTRTRRRAFSAIDEELSEHIRKRVSLHTSPNVISGELRRRGQVAPSKNTIYRYLAKLKAIGDNLYQALPHSGKPYAKSGRTGVKSKIVGRIGIENRPEIAGLKMEPGHVEADTIFGKDQASFLLTLVDKCTRSVVIRKLPNKCAETVTKAFKEIVSSTFYVFKTITSDNGTEFAGHKDIAQITRADFYFANPYSSWERGVNEHTNGLIRRFFPKGTDFNEVPDEEIARVEHILNTRGRAVLDFRSPNEVFLEHLMAA
jgi:transposase, IS30 family